MRWRVLAICSELNRRVIETAMAGWSLDLRSCTSVQEARVALRGGRYPVILCEELLPDGTYRDVLHLLGHKALRTRLVVMATSDLDDCYHEAQQLGAFDVIANPVQRTDVQWIVIRAVQDHHLRSTQRPREPQNEEVHVNSGAIE